MAIPESLEADKWEFMGIKKDIGDGVLYFGNVPENYKNSSMYCEHCNSRRYRRSVIIIKDLETGKILQVGKSCVKKYLGSAFEILGTLLLAIDEILEDSGSGYERGYTFFSAYIETKRFLYHCLEDMKKRGYIKKDTYVNDKPVKPTAFEALDRHDKDEVINYDYSEIDEAIEVYKAFVAKQGESDFSHNVIALLNESYIERKYINYIAFVPSFLLNKRKFEAEKKAREKEKARFNKELTNSYLGTVKDKITCNARLIHIRTFETCYTYAGELNYMYTFITNKGELVQWKTQKSLATCAENFDELIEHKHMFSITGTIKECKEFKGRLYTVLTRCKIN